MRTLLVILCLMLGTTAATAGPLQLTATTRGSTVTLIFTNPSGPPIRKFGVRVKADIEMYDWLSIDLVRAGAPKRTFSFVEGRDKSAMIEIDIAPGKSHRETLDLAWWALRADNGGPLDPGQYELAIRWTIQGKVLATTTKLVVAEPRAKPLAQCRDRASTGLALLTQQRGKTSEFDIGIHNTDRVAHCIAAVVQAGEPQSDWHSIAFGPWNFSSAPRAIRFADTRTRAAVVYVELSPGATHWTRWDVAAWAKRAPNGATALASGSFQATITYDASGERSVWRGKLAERIPANL